MSLPIFDTTDRLQTTWASILNPVILTSNNFNTVPPSYVILRAGSGIYNTPTNCFYLQIRMLGGGGGGGAGNNSSGGNGTNGGNTTFGPSFLIAHGGFGGPANDLLGGAGGFGSNVSSLPNVSGFAIGGGSGQAGYTNLGGQGGVSVFGGAGGGAGLNSGAVAQNGSFNTGGGGGGGYGNSVNGGGGGGGAEYVEAIISNPKSSYPFSIGVGGITGSVTAGGALGGSGGSGIIIIFQAFQ